MRFSINTENWTLTAETNNQLLKLAKSGRIKETDVVTYAYGKRTCMAAQHPVLKNFFKKIETEKTQVRTVNPLMFAPEHQQNFYSDNETEAEREFFSADQEIITEKKVRVNILHLSFLALMSLFGVALVRGLVFSPWEAAMWDEAVRALLTGSDPSHTLTPSLIIKSGIGAILGALGGFVVALQGDR